MPTKTWEPPPAEQDRDGRAAVAEKDQPRNLDTAARSSDANPDVLADPDILADPPADDINFNGSER